MKSSFPDIPEMWRHEISEIRLRTTIIQKKYNSRVKTTEITCHWANAQEIQYESLLLESYEMFQTWQQ